MEKSKGLVTALLLTTSAGVNAQNATYEDVIAWLQDNPNVTVSAGKHYGREDLGSLSAFVPPGFIDLFDFDGVVVEIQPTAHYEPHVSYQSASAEHRDLVQIADDGALLGFTAGQPFTDDQISAASATKAGYMVAWNHIFRWQGAGYATQILMTYVRPGDGGTHTVGMEGGGVVIRSMTLDYRRIYLNALAYRPDDGYQLNVGDGGDLYWKEYVEFLDPFDLAGTKFIVERAIDPTLGDQVYSYLPGQRRVRRLSAKERADSWMGSDFTLDDLQGFSGRVLDYDWQYRGRKGVLHVADSMHPQAVFFGPSSRVPKDRWQVRPCHVVELVPRWAGHPYGKRLQFVDSESYNTTLALIFDRHDVLWKIVYTAYEYPEHEPGDNRSLEQSVPHWSALVGIDLLANTTTLSREAPDSQSNYEEISAAAIRRIFDVSALTSGR